MASEDLMSTIIDLRNFTKGKKYNTIYADPPWQFQNRTGKVAPEHKRLTLLTLRNSLLPSWLMKRLIYIYGYLMLCYQMGLQSWIHGGLNISLISFGKKSEKMASQMDEALVFIFEMLRK